MLSNFIRIVFAWPFDSSAWTCYPLYGLGFKGPFFQELLIDSSQANHSKAIPKRGPMSLVDLVSNFKR